MVMARRTRGHKLHQSSWHPLFHDCYLLGYLPQDLVLKGSKRAGDIRIDVSIDIESITTMF